MASIMYKTGLELLSPEVWTDGLRTFVALLIDDAASYVPDVDDATIFDVSGSEVGALGYARVTVGSRTATWDGVNDRWKLGCSALGFGGIVLGTDVAGMIVAEDIDGDDTLSPLIAWVEFSPVEDTDGAAFTVTPDTGGLLRVS